MIMLKNHQTDTVIEKFYDVSTSPIDPNFGHSAHLLILLLPLRDNRHLKYPPNTLSVATASASFTTCSSIYSPNSEHDSHKTPKNNHYPLSQPCCQCDRLFIIFLPDKKAIAMMAGLGRRILKAVTNEEKVMKADGDYFTGSIQRIRRLGILSSKL